MKDFKRITTPTETRYVLESMTAGATGASNIATSEVGMGNMIKRQQEAKDERVPQKPRQGPLRPQTGAGAHKDKKRDQKQGKEKHRKPYFEGHPDHEVEMAQADTYQLAKQAMALHKMLMRASEMQGLEGWQQAKITKAADYINAVYKNLSHDVAMDGDIDEQKLSELDKPSGTMFLKFAKKQLPDKESQLYGYAGFGSNIKDVNVKNAKIKPFIINTFDDLEYNIEKILRDVDFVGTEKIIIDIPNWLPDNIMGDLDVLVQMDDRLEFHEVDPDDDDGDSSRGGSIIRIDPATGRQLRLKPPTPKAQVGGSSHDTPVQPQTFKYTLQQTDLMPKLRSMGFKFSGNQIVLSKQQRDQLVQKLGDKFQSIFGKAEKFTEAEGSSYQTDSMVSHISQIIGNIYPQGGDKNTYMKLVAREMPRIVQSDPKLFRRAFGIAYDRFFHIDQDDDNDNDYTDYSMRQGERGMEEGVAGPKNCWPGHRKVGTKPGTGKNAGKRVNDCEKIKETDVDESGLQYHTGVKKHGEKYMKMAAAAGRRGASQEELGRLKDRYSKAYKKENVDVGEAKKPAMNFDIEDIKRLEQIKDLATLKAQAFSLISKPSAKPMKPEKVAWFKSALERMDSPIKVIKLMYDLLLGGEGQSVIGSRYSMNPNSYRSRFGEDPYMESLWNQLYEKAPEGWEGTVKAMKKHKEIDNPYALTHWMKNKGYKSHKPKK